ncbi:MAG: amidohydrolase family protein [Ilumatobacteraceae bacterium]
MIVDCHGHYTTAPSQLGDYRDEQIRALGADPTAVGARGVLDISDDELRASLEPHQLRLQRERGIDLTLFSPRASWMGHHIGNAHTSRFWTEHCNDLVRRVCDLYPANFAPVCQLPQTGADPVASVRNSVAELRRCVDGMGFVGCNLNPDPSGGMWNGPTLHDPVFWPLYEAMCELDVPAMIHVSASCNPHFHATGSHYLGADTTAFVQALTSGIFRDFPDMRWVIPHGGGAVPYHWGRFKGMAEENGWQRLDELMSNIHFDTCVYHQPGIDLLVAVVPTENILFASEMVGAVKGSDPDTGEYYDDTKRYVDRADLTDEQRTMIYETNVARVYPRVAPHLEVGS